MLTAAMLAGYCTPSAFVPSVRALLAGAFRSPRDLTGRGGFVFDV